MKLTEITDARTVYDNCTVTFKLSCAFCGDNGHEEDIDVSDPDPKKMFLDSLNEAGWMEMESEQYAQIGYACPECIKAEKHWEIDNAEG